MSHCARPPLEVPETVKELQRLVCTSGHTGWWRALPLKYTGSRSVTSNNVFLMFFYKPLHLRLWAVTLLRRTGILLGEDFVREKLRHMSASKGHLTHI